MQQTPTRTYLDGVDFGERALGFEVLVQRLPHEQLRDEPVHVVALGLAGLEELDDVAAVHSAQDSGLDECGRL